MEIQTLWLLILSLATPIAGVVGFAIQLRQVKKARLENEKLQLEIAALKMASERRSQLVQSASLEEIERYGRNPPIFSQTRGKNPDPEPYKNSSSIGEWLTGAVFFGLIFLLVGYAIYDIYRLARWVINAL